MKKRLLISLLLAVLITAMPMSFVFASGDNGQNSRSQSMSAESGDEPIADLSVTEDPGVASGIADTDAEADDEPGIVDKALGLIKSFDIRNINFGNLNREMIIIPAAGGAAALLILIILIKAVRSRKRRTAYISKH